MAQQIRRIDPLSAAKVCAVLYGLMGLLIVPIFWVVGSLAPGAGGVRPAGLVFIIGVPLAYAAIGFLFTLIGAALYNLVAGWVGGIEVELQ